MKFSKGDFVIHRLTGEKLLILIICMFAIMNCAVAQENGQAWKVCVCSIEAEKENSMMMCTQDIEIIAGERNGDYWAEACIQRSVDLVMQPCLTFQAELKDNTFIGSIEGANDALSIADAESFFNGYGISLTDVEMWLNGLFGMFENRVDPKIENLKVDFYKNGDNGGYFEVDLPEMKIRFQLLWEKYDGDIPFDFAAKNIQNHSENVTSLGAGTDLPDAFNQGLTELKKSSSFCAMLEFILNEQ